MHITVHNLQFVADLTYDIIKKLNDLFSPQNTIQVIKSREMRRAGHVACIGMRREMHT